MPKFMKVATTDELEDQQAKLVEVEGQKIALFRVGEAFHALSDTCTHRGGPLSEGTVEGAEVTCPWHGARFDIKTKTTPETFDDRCWSASREPQRSMTSRGYDPRQSPGLGIQAGCVL